MELTGQTHLTNAVFVEAVVVAQNGYLVGHRSAYTRPVVYLQRESRRRFPKSVCTIPFFHRQKRKALSSREAGQSQEEKKTYSPSSKQMAALHRLKDVGSQFRLAGQVGLGQRLLHPLDLHQTQCPLVSCSTHTHRRRADAPFLQVPPKRLEW